MLYVNDVHRGDMPEGRLMHDFFYTDGIVLRNIGLRGEMFQGEQGEN